MFLILFRNILCPQQMFPSLHSPRNIMGNNMSATMCPRLPGPLGHVHTNPFSNENGAVLLQIRPEIRLFPHYKAKKGSPKTENVLQSGAI